ncbi:MAG: FecR family protein [Prolixibacteraceae bacterium]|nr:FecR family protein [Prolixibacteraceae bacterium]
MKNKNTHILESRNNSSNNNETDFQLDEFLKKSTDTPENNHLLKKIWIGIDHLSNTKKYSAENAWEKVDSRIKLQTKNLIRRQKFLYTTMGAAASILLIVSSFILFSTNNFNYNFTASTNNGDKSTLFLPDGSQVKLNAASSLHYSYDPFKRKREVIFSGEGFFDVAKSKQPFFITTESGLKVKVLGTKFNLKTYAEDETVETTLIEGNVELVSSSNQKLLMHPGQVAVYKKVNQQLSLSNRKPEYSFGWLQNKIYLDKTSLYDVTVLLERWYDVDITVRNYNYENEKHYSGVLSEESITDILDGLVELSNITYSIEGRKIIINGN